MKQRSSGRNRTGVQHPIWQMRPEYNLRSAQLSHSNMIARLQSIEACKKRIPPIPIAKLEWLAKEIPAHVSQIERAKTDAEKIRCISQFLAIRVEVPGAGIKILLAMAAVLSESKCLAPIDEKNTSGLLRKNKIKKHEYKALNGSDIQLFSVIYVKIVLPLWCKERAKNTKWDRIDELWMEA